MPITLANDPKTQLMIQMMQAQQQAPMRRGGGFMNAADKLAQAFMMKKMLGDIEGRKASAADERSNAVRLAMGRPAETQSYDDGTTINWNEQKPNVGLAAESLGPDNADLQEKLMTKMMGVGGSDTPSAIQEYEYFKNLSPAQQQIYLQSKRQTVSPGMFITPEGSAAPIPDYMPAQASIESNKAGAKEFGKQQGEAKANLNAAYAAMPQLDQAVAKLSELGQKATYTAAGQGVDIANRQLGLEPRESAVAREAYIAHVKNNVLPLLRRTFGAQFTKAEGDSLLATLGDPNKAPAEKDAVLKAFIEDKKATLGTLQREVVPPSPDVMMKAIKNTPAGSDLEDVPAAFEPGSTDPMAPPLAKSSPKRIRIDANGNIIQ